MGSTEVRTVPSQASSAGECRELTQLAVRAEVWEPLLTTLLERVEVSGKSLPVDEVWAIDCINQGDAGVLNEPVLGEVCASQRLLPRSFSRSL